MLSTRKPELRRSLALAGLILFAVPVGAAAEVQRIEIDVTGYLCGL